MRLIFTLFVLFPTTIFGQTVKGTVLDVKRNKPISSAIITFLTKDSVRHVEFSDETGKFEFKNLSPGNYEISFSSIGYQDTSFKEIFVKRDTTINLEYVRNCPYDESINKNVCPKCHKKNAVIPILYGLPYSKNGEDPAKGNGKKFLLAGCLVSDCDPNWYCRRDKIRF